MEVWVVLAIVSVVAAAVVYFLWPKAKHVNIKTFPRKFPDEKGIETSYYDVIVVGAGPSGSTLGYYLGNLGRKVLLLEKKKFPRDKYCGDAVCKTGIEILHEMGVYEELIRDNKAHIADWGGMVSPSGLSYIGRSHEELGKIPGALACKRILLDEAIARAAQRAGANLVEESPVQDAKFDKSTGLWTVTIEDSETTYQGRVLVCADGATSKLAIQLGLVKQAPQGSCSRAYVEGGTHKFNADGVLFYHKSLLPGYAVLFRHPNDVLNYCIYLIPGNPLVTNDDLAYWHEHLKKNDPNISKALGKNFKIERMRAGSLRIGGEPLTYGDHVLVIGDAAGMTDPMTGEGIHTAMDSGRIAAHLLDEAFAVGNFDSAVMAEYQNRWMENFGSDFSWSMKICQITYRYPILLDAATAAVARKGDRFLARWADIMTGRVPKVHLLRPEFVIVITFELIVLLLKRLFGMKSPEPKESSREKTE